ncbi:MAG: S-adenosylmethionine decarboxylase [Verrucomicrobiota bacterium]|jgi:S-adenosylmethionine decarboxylase proenzyme
MKTHGPFASQMLIELHGCKAAVLNDPAALKDLLLEAVRRGHGTIVTDVFHTFSPHGVSGVIVIAESHVAIHTWPEHGYAAVDIFSCGTKLDHAVIRDWIAAGMGASNVEFQELTRG